MATSPQARDGSGWSGVLEGLPGELPTKPSLSPEPALALTFLGATVLA